MRSRGLLIGAGSSIATHALIFRQLQNCELPKVSKCANWKQPTRPRSLPIAAHFRNVSWRKAETEGQTSGASCTGLETSIPRRRIRSWKTSTQGRTIITFPRTFKMDSDISIALSMRDSSSYKLTEWGPRGDRKRFTMSATAI